MYQEQPGEKLTPLWAMQVTRRCDSCEEGTMEFDPAVTGFQLSFAHKCSACGATDVYDKRYPCVDHVPFEGPIPDLVGLHYYTGILMNLFDERYLKCPPKERQDVNQFLRLLAGGAPVQKEGESNE